MKLGRLRSLQGMLRLSRLCQVQTSWSRRRWALQAPPVRMRIHHWFLLHAIAAAAGLVAAALTRHRRAAGARTRSLAPVTASRLAVRRCRALQAMAAAALGLPPLPLFKGAMTATVQDRALPVRVMQSVAAPVDLLHTAAPALNRCEAVQALPAAETHTRPLAPGLPLFRAAKANTWRAPPLQLERKCHPAHGARQHERIRRLGLLPAPSFRSTAPATARHRLLAVRARSMVAAPAETPSSWHAAPRRLLRLFG